MGDNKSERKNFKKWRSRNGSDSVKSSSSKVKVNEPFQLSLSQKSRWAQWRDWIADQAKYEFGVLGQMCDTDKYPTLPLINIDEYDLANKDDKVSKMNSALFLSACQDRKKSIRLMKLDYPKLYSLIKRHLSHDSIAMVMMSEHFDIDKYISDPLKL